MKFLKFSSAFLAAMLLFTSCSQPAKEDSTDAAGSTADNANSANGEQTAPVTDSQPGTDNSTNNKQGLIKTVQTDGAENLFLLENGNVLLLRTPTIPHPGSNPMFGETSYEEGSLIIYDSDIEKKITEIPIEPFHEGLGIEPLYVQIVEDGFAFINMNEKYIKLYDNDGNETKKINPPYYENAEYVVSYDKTRIAYYYTDSELGEGHLITDSVELNDKKEIMTLKGGNEDKTDALVNIERLFSYNNGIIAFSGYIQTDEVTSDGKTVLVCGRCNYDGEEVVLIKLKELEILNTNFLQYQKNHFVIIEASSPNPDIQPSSGIVKYQKYGEDKIGELTCEKNDENHFAVISDNGKYIATLISSTDNQLAITMKIYDTSDGKLLYTHSFNLEQAAHVSSITIKEQERKAYVFWFEYIDVIGF